MSFGSPADEMQMEKTVRSMRIKTIKAARTAISWIQRVLEVRLPMDALYGLHRR